MLSGCRNRKVPIDQDRELYREHNVVERGIGWFKQYHRLTTHFEKIASSYLVIAVHHWLQNHFAANVHTP